MKGGTMDERVSVIVEAITTSVAVWYVNRHETELAIRCPECGDSIKNPTHAHCNIRLTDPEAIVWHCVRNDCHGLVDAEFMRRIGVFSEKGVLAAHRNAMSIRKKIGKAARAMTGGRSDKLPSPKLVPASGESTLQKLKYLNDRLGLKVKPFEAANKLKLVPDLRALFRANPWMKPTEEKFMMTRLADDGLGFMSADKTHIIFRDTTNKWNKRYFNYKIHNLDIPSASKLYFISNKINLLSPKFTIVAAEGIFDAIAVAYHHEPDTFKSDSMLVAGASGKGYPWLIKSIRKMGFLDLKVKIYSDSDVDISYYKWLIGDDPLLNSGNIEIYYNDYKKEDKHKRDFGVPSDHVKIRRASVSKYA
jgi:hypothetical protein